MQTRTDWRAGALALCVALVTTLSSCDMLVPAGQSSTISLLRVGSPKVCVANDVQNTLTALIVPKVESLAGEATNEDKRTAVAGVVLSYDTTTLQSFDPAVQKASCDTTVSVHTNDGRLSKFSVSYQVSPSAENSAAFVLTANADDTEQYVRDLIKTSLDEAVTRHQGEQQAIEEAQTRATLLATVTPKWLVGSWVNMSEGASACSDGTAMAFQANHAVEGGMVTARWALTANKLHIVGQSPTTTIDQTWTITEADALSFQYEGSSSGSYRRCSHEEMSEPITSSEDNIQ